MAPSLPAVGGTEGLGRLARRNFDGVEEGEDVGHAPIKVLVQEKVA